MHTTTLKPLSLAPLPHFDALPLEFPCLDVADSLWVALLVDAFAKPQRERECFLTVFVPIVRPAMEYSTF